MNREEHIAAQKELAGRLRSGNLAERRGAAQALLGLARAREDLTFAIRALVTALDDPDAEVRLDAARTLVIPRLGLLSGAWLYLERALASTSFEQRSQAEQALFAAARDRFDANVIAQALLPILIKAYENAESARAQGFLFVLIGECATRGARLAEHLPVLIAALSRPRRTLGAAMMLSRLAAQKVDIQPARAELESALKRGRKVRSAADASRRYACAQALARVAVQMADGELAMRLVKDADSTVREGAAAGFGPAGQEGFVKVVAALGAALGDDQAGVVYRAMQALIPAARDQVDLGDAVGGLEQLLEVREYSREGWALGLHLDRASLSRESPREQAAALLVRHLVAHREREALRRLLAHPEPAIGRSAEDMLEKIAHEADDLLRRWIDETRQP